VLIEKYINNNNINILYNNIIQKNIDIIIGIKQNYLLHIDMFWLIKLPNILCNYNFNELKNFYQNANSKINLCKVNNDNNDIIKLYKYKNNNILILFND